MAREVNKFILEGEEIEFTDSAAREDINDLDTKVDNNYNTLDNKIDSEATRLDGRVDTVNNRVTSEATRLDGKINTQGVPAGGTTSQILAKTSNNDYATQWVNPPTPGPGGSDIDDGVIALDKTWSSNKINSEDNSIRQVIAPLQNDLIADKSYIKYDRFYYNGNLYKATAAIPQNDNIVIDSNCVIDDNSLYEIKDISNNFTFVNQNFTPDECKIQQVGRVIFFHLRGSMLVAYGTVGYFPFDLLHITPTVVLESIASGVYSKPAFLKVLNNRELFIGYDSSQVPSNYKLNIDAVILI